MSTSPYSLDLRQKVIKYIESGGSQISASKIFSLNKNTVSSWWRRYCSEGSINPRKRLGSKAKVDLEKFILYVESHPNDDAGDIGKYFGISASGARYWLKKIGFSYKKKLIPMWKRMKKKEQNF